MIRIVICMSSPEKAQSLFESAMETLKKLNVKCELSYSTNYGKVLDNLQASINYYDILILDFHDTSCLNLAKTIRSRNFVASIIFVTNIEASLHNSLKFRPTAFITAFDDTQQLSDALSHMLSGTEVEISKSHYPQIVTQYDEFTNRH